MSFLENLKNRRTLLKQTDTLVTCVDGRRFIERHSTVINNQEILIPQSNSVGYVIDTAPDATPSIVVPNLFIGSQDCCAPDAIKTHNIHQVLSVGIESPHKVPGIEYFHVDCLDLPDTHLKPICDECNPIIGNALKNQKNILVHCNAGVSRSAAVIIGFLMQELHFNYVDAYEQVKTVRRCIQPNPGFCKQLKSL